MRIAFAHYSTEDDIGGVSTWLIRLASELRRQGWPVAVLLPHTGNHPARSTIASALRAADVEVVLQPQLSSDNSAVLQTLGFFTPVPGGSLHRSSYRWATRPPLGTDRAFR
jgi:hypothetical protein